MDEEIEKQPREMQQVIEFAEDILEKLRVYNIPRGHDGPRVAEYNHRRWLEEKRVLDICCNNLSSMIPKDKALLEDPEKGPFHHETIKEVRILFNYASLLYRAYLRKLR